MKMNKLAYAVAGATAMMTGAAHALIPGVDDSNGNVKLDIYMSGATALDKQLKFYFTDLCQTGTLDIFTDDLSKPQGKSFSAYYCVLGPAEVPGLSGTFNVMLHKRSRGGSAWGVGPVAGAVLMDQMVIQGETNPGDGDFCGDLTGAAPGSDTTNGVTTDVWLCDNSQVVQERSHAGISDVEPALFNEFENLIDVNDDPSISLGEPGTVPVSDALLNNMEIRAMNSTTFGIIATKDLRDALQEHQGLVPGSETLENMPSLSRDMIRSVLGGVIKDWNDIKNGAGVGLFASATGDSYASDRSQINVCRRVEGSGTQAQANAVFNSVGCGAVQPVATDNTPGSSLSDGVGAGDDEPSGGFGLTVSAIHENFGSGDVTDCMSTLQNYVGPVNGDSVWALGIQSLEKADSDFRFIRINGVAPVLESVAANEYLDAVTTSIQWRTGPVNGVPAPAGDIQSILESIRTNASNPTTIASLNASLQSKSAILENDGVTKANIGALALYYKGFTPSTPWAASNPVTCSSREGELGNLPPNSCSIPTVFRGECNTAAGK